MAQVNDLSRSLTAFDPLSTLVVVVEMSKASWLVSGAVPRVERQPLKKLEPDATALSRERKRAKTDRLDAAMLMRVILGWLRGERGHCGMVAIPTLQRLPNG